MDGETRELMLQYFFGCVENPNILDTDNAKEIKQGWYHNIWVIIVNYEWNNQNETIELLGNYICCYLDIFSYPISNLVDTEL